MSYEVRVLADSVSSSGGVRLTTVLATFPRFILAEINTHRMLSRSSASSRAIPVEKRIKAIKEDPFVPESFGVNRSGMQATEVLVGNEAFAAELAWLHARDIAVKQARQLAELGVHKQYANRLLEPFSWHTAVITATEWSNFFALRCHPAAQPEFRRIAEMIRDAVSASTPKAKSSGEWHLPFVEGAPDENQVFEEVILEDPTRPLLVGPKLAEISCARAARVSYLLHDGTRSIEKDRALAKQLRESGHMAPFEHAARPIQNSDRAMPRLRGYYELDGCGWVGNLHGWVQYRKLLLNEHDFGLHLAGGRAS